MEDKMDEGATQAHSDLAGDAPPEQESVDEPARNEPPLPVRNRITPEAQDYVPVRNRITVTGCELAGNVFWTVLVGWWVALFYLVAAVLCVCSPVHARLCCNLGWYFLWPFNKYVFIAGDREQSEGKPAPGLMDQIGFGYFAGVAAIILVPAHCLAAVIGWLLVYFVPMSRLHTTTTALVFCYANSLTVGRRHPQFSPNEAHGEIVLNHSTAGCLRSFSTTVAGTNIIILNMMPIVVASIALGFALSAEARREYRYLLFGVSLIAVVPLCFTVGSLISRIAAVHESSLFGLMLSCTVGRCVEVLLYLQLMHHALNDLVRDSLVGALVALMLLLPAMSFLVGGLKFREQRFNLANAGLSTVMLVVSVVGGFTPTLFHESYAKLEMFCSACYYIPDTNDLSIGCGSCHYKSKNLSFEPLYKDYTKHLAITCAIMLPTAYLCGLAALHNNDHDKLEEEEEPSSPTSPLSRKQPMSPTSPDRSLAETLQSMPALLKEGVHGSMGWTITECSIAMVICVGLSYCVTRVLAESASMIFPNDVSTSESTTGVRLVGFVLLALVPNTLHFVNSMSFAFHNKVGVSIEIASSAVIQITLIEIPLLIFISSFADFITSQEDPFTMIFSTFHVFAVVFSMVILNYISLASRVNYFEGVALLVVYLVWVGGFVFMPSKQLVGIDGSYGSNTTHFNAPV